MTRVTVLALAGSLLTVAGVGGQEIVVPPGANDVPTRNLKVLPKEQNRTFGEILPAMQAMRDALGVGCVYCHTYTAPYNPANDFVSDAKPAKEKALAMLRMVQAINQTIRTEIPRLDKPATSRQAVGVTCVTCHRGTAIPRELVDVVTETGNTKGAAAAVAQYRELRGRFYGAEAYDFTDTTLFVAAQRALTANKPDDAIAYAQLNVEFNPKSGRSYQLMSQAYVAKKDNASAITAMEKAVEAQPNNDAFKAQLERLKKPGA
jgi:hypothetical protein